VRHPHSVAANIARKLVGKIGSAEAKETRAKRKREIPRTQIIDFIS
jgi:hypothetical protein